MFDFHIPELRAGSYHVSVEAITLKRAPTREPMLEYLFRVLDDHQQGEHGRSQQIITPDTYAGMVQNLKVCGVECEARDIAGHLPQARGVELDISISDDAAAVTIARRLDSRSLDERGISEAAEPLPDVAEMLVLACGDGQRIELCSIEDWDCTDSLLLELDPTFQTIEGEQ